MLKYKADVWRCRFGILANITWEQTLNVMALTRSWVCCVTKFFFVTGIDEK